MSLRKGLQLQPFRVSLTIIQVFLNRQKKVRKVMDDLGYVPNMTARNLGKRISSAIGVILPPLDSKERLGIHFI